MVRHPLPAIRRLFHAARDIAGGLVEVYIAHRRYAALASVNGRILTRIGLSRDDAQQAVEASL